MHAITHTYSLAHTSLKTRASSHTHFLQLSALPQSSWLYLQGYETHAFKQEMTSSNKRGVKGCSVECLLLDVSVSLIDELVKVLHALGVNVSVVVVVDEALGVVLVLDLHAGEAAHVDVRAEVLACSHALVHCHVQVKGRVGLGLAVPQAISLLGSLGGGELIVNTVLLAFGEEKLRERVGHERLALVSGVSCPIRHFIII